MTAMTDPTKTEIRRLHGVARSQDYELGHCRGAIKAALFDLEGALAADGVTSKRYIREAIRHLKEACE